MKNNKVMVLTLGCSKNTVDSEGIIGSLRANGIQHTENIDEADTIIINTCGFIKPAKEESLKYILSATELKNQGKIKKVIVSGCLSERYLKELNEQLENVDLITGVNASEEITKFLKPDLKYNLVGERELLTPKHYAYLKISEGCNHPCSFCAIPLIRGKYVSRDINDLIAEGQSLVKKGVKELIIIAQDSTFYGVDIYKKSQLADLLRRLSDIDNLSLLRLLYTYPLNFPFEVLDVMNERENICKYLDMPLQHVSSTILKSMKRKMNYQQTSDLVDKIRYKVKDVAIRSTFIVGYPGETEEDFELLKRFIIEKRLDRVGVFTYSHEENTKAFELKDDIPENVKEERRNILMEAQMEISLERNKNFVGKELKVIVDEKMENKYIARTQWDAPEVDNSVIITSKKRINIGDFINVKINSADAYDLFAKY
jgi:ribosomal protein S12 methylthiotransferase